MPVVALIVWAGIYSSNPKDMGFMISKSALCVEVWFALQGGGGGRGEKGTREIHAHTHTPPALPDVFQASLSSTGYVATYGVSEQLEEDWCVCSCPEFYVENAVQSAEPKYLFENT